MEKRGVLIKSMFFAQKLSDRSICDALNYFSVKFRELFFSGYVPEIEKLAAKEL